MNKFARTAQSREGAQPIVVARPYSFFELASSKEFRGLDSLRRILSQVRKHNVQTMLVEELCEGEDLREENEDIKTRYPGFTESKSFRLSFFTKSFTTLRGLFTAGSDDFIGYAVIKKDHVPERGGARMRVYESVIRRSGHSNNYIRGEQTWNCRICGASFSASGFLYAQQNNMTNVCAHVALRTAAARYHKAGDMSYREMNELVGIDHIQKRAGGADGRGLTSAEMVHILESVGAKCFVGDYTDPSDPPVPYQKYLYGSVESGYPAILFFGTTDVSGAYHTIPVFGHTFNEDTWVPNADDSYFRIGAGTEYIPSESWLSMFIAHDDNWGSNFCIPRRYLHTRRVCTRPSEDAEFCVGDSEGIAYVIGTVPKAVELSPIRAEAIGAGYLFSIVSQMPALEGPWDERLARATETARVVQTANATGTVGAPGKADKLILRPIHVRKSEYIDHLKAVRDWDGRVIRRKLIASLKEFLQEDSYWLIELSLPQLFPANRRKVGEVLIRSEKETGPERDMKSFVVARLLGYFSLYTGGGSTNPKYRFLPSGVKSHVELFGCEEES